MMTWTNFGNRKNIRCSTRMLWQVVDLAQPVMVNGKCAECGGPWSDSSPQVVQHDLFCRGVDRANKIAKLISQQAARRRSWWQRLIFWV